MTKLIFILIPIAFFIQGCATTSQMNHVNLGMTKQEVIKVMGEPSSTSATEGVEYMNYDLYLTALRFGEYVSQPYYIRIVGGKVDSFGRKGDFGTTAPPTQKLVIETSQK